MRDIHQLMFCDETTSIITKSPYAYATIAQMHNSMAYIQRALNQHNFLPLYTAFVFLWRLVLDTLHFWNTLHISIEALICWTYVYWCMQSCRKASANCSQHTLDQSLNWTTMQLKGPKMPRVLKTILIFKCFHFIISTLILISISLHTFGKQMFINKTYF